MVIDEDVVTRSYDVDDFDDLLNDLLSEIEVHNYRITRINHIDNVLDQKERGLSTKMRFTHYKIVEFCNLNSCAEMLSADLLSGVFMPVRFIAYQGVDDQKVYVSFLRPTRFAALFSATGVMDIAVGLEKDMSDVLEELA
ncbi:MAG: DUF302 domain-containing protein [Gammaproteobacteria bacterium]|nr:DUF302 domain-containing protein [Gammaproteobacteria bacterium]